MGPGMTSTLRPHQADALDRLRSTLSGGKRRPILQAPTGFGKTLVAATMAQGAIARGRKVAFIAPAISLIDQTVDRFWREGIRDVGVIQGSHPLTDWSRPVQVCSVETLRSRDAMPDVQLVVVDEAHRRSRWLEEWMKRDGGATPVVGLSATPWTKGLGEHYDDLVVGATTADLIAGGWLSPFRVFAPQTPDLKGVKKTAGDYHTGQLSELMGQKTIVADVVTTWLERAERRPTLVFAVDRAHAQELVEQYKAADVPTGYIDAFTPREDRLDIERRFNGGDLPVVVNVGCLTTGIDWDVRCIQLARPTASEMLHVQIIGRGLRTAPGKDDCLILDHAGNHCRLGFVTDIAHPELCSGEGNGERKRLEGEDETPLPKACPQCSYLRPPKVRECPSCGFVARPASGVLTEDGELVEMAPGGRSKGRQAPSIEERQRWYSGLLAYARERNHKRGWAYYSFRDKFGFRPNLLREIPSETVPPEVRSWVRSRNIARAKAKAREAA